MGGDTEHFSLLIDTLNDFQNIEYTVFNTSRGNNNPSLIKNIYIACKLIVHLLLKINKYNAVSLHASDRGMFCFGPIIYFYGKLFRKKIILRIFGGSFNDYYFAKSKIIRIYINNTILSADIILMQTKRMINDLNDKCKGNIIWFSTYRSRPKNISELYDKHDHCSKFIFIGHMWKTKGIETILEVSSKLPDECSIDLYGPLDEYNEGDINSRGNGRVKYCGFLSHEQVYEIIQDYQCLILPTYHDGEGYPGVIVEAYIHGLPVITTRWLAIPEIVDSSCGILINPKSPDELVESIKLINSDKVYWKKLSICAKKKAVLYNPDYWTNVFIDSVLDITE